MSMLITTRSAITAAISALQLQSRAAALMQSDRSPAVQEHWRTQLLQAQATMTMHLNEVQLVLAAARELQIGVEQITLAQVADTGLVAFLE